MSDKRIQQLRSQLPEGTTPDLNEGMEAFVGNGPAANLPAPPTDFSLSQQRLDREEKATFGDYLGSMWRQDGLVDGTVAAIVGQQLLPDPNYNVHDAKTWAELTEGIDPEFHDAFYSAHSAPHASLIRDRLVQKQVDLQRLGDMGVGGQIGRFVGGALMPDQILAAMMGGWVTRGVKGFEIANATRKAGAGIDAAEAGARVAANQAGRAASSTAIVAGIASGGAGNAAFEQLRQNVNFEDSTSEVLLAGLLGAAITTPFAFAGARAEKRIAAAAQREHNALRVLKAVDEGAPLDAAGAKVLKEVVDSHRAVRDVMAGRLSPEEVRGQLDAAHVGPQLEDAAWLKRYGDDLSAQGTAILDQMFPRRGIDQTTKRIMPEGPQQLRLGYDPTAGNGPLNTLRVDSKGNVLTPIESPTVADVSKHIKKLREDQHRAEAAIRKMTAEGVAAAPKRSLKSLFKDVQDEAPGSPNGLDSLRKLVGDTETHAEMPPAPKVVEEPVVQAEASAQPVVAPEATPAPTGPQVGQLVDFTKRGKEDEFYSGVIESISDEGFVKLRDEDGKLHTVHLSRLLVNEPVPQGFHPGGSVGAAQTVAFQDPATQLTAMSKARLDIFATLNRSESMEVRKLVFDLVKDPIQNDEVSAQGWTASEHKSHIKRTVAGLFHRESREAANEAAKVQGVPLWARSQFNAEFHSLVSRFTRGDASIQVTHKDIMPMIQRASAAQKKVYSYLLEQAKQAGVKGADEVETNALYVNRIWNHRGIAEAIRLHGGDQVINLLAKAINVPGLIGDKKKAAAFLGAVRKLEFAPVMQNIHLYAQDMGTLRKELASSGKLSDTEIDTLVDAMFVAKEATGADAGRAAQLKYRFDLEETLSANTPNGVLRIADLLENDSRVLVDLYANSMGGQIGLAKKGFTSQADFMERMRLVTEEALGNPKWDGERLKRDITLLEDVYSSIAGKPMSTQDFSTSARVASTMRGYTRSLMLGQLGLTAAFEMSQAVGYMGLKAAVQHMPSFRQFFYAIRKGYIPDVALARDIEQMVGFGHEMDMSFARQHEIDESGVGRLLTAAEAGANKASHAVDVMSGNASMTSMTRQWSGMMATQQLYDYATGLKKLTDARRTRFVGQGLDLYEVDGVLADLKTYTTAGHHGKVEEVNWEQWLKESPETYEKFQLTLSRMVRDAVQDHDLGETMPFMHSTLGKMFAELKTFMLVAHAKNFLKNLHYRDATSMQVLMVSLVGNALAYMTQTAINNAHDPAKLEEMLTLDRIVRAIGARTSVLGLLPIGAEFGYGVASGGESLFMPGSTGNTDNRTVVPPSGIILNRLLHAPANLMNAASPYEVLTRKEGRELTGLTPNLWGLRNAANYWTNSLPTSEPQQAP